MASPFDNMNHDDLSQLLTLKSLTPQTRALIQERMASAQPQAQAEPESEAQVQPEADQTDQGESETSADTEESTPVADRSPAGLMSWVMGTGPIVHGQSSDKTPTPQPQQGVSSPLPSPTT